MNNAATALPPSTGVWQSWCQFWFAPRDVIALHALRVLVGTWILIALLPFINHAEAFFSLRGWFDTQAYLAAANLPEGTPHRITWSLFYALGDNSAGTPYLYWLFMGGTILFTLGIMTRWTGILTWLGVASCTANPAAITEADTLLLMTTFYLMLGYLGLHQWQPHLSWNERWLGAKPRWWGWLRRRPMEPEPESSAAQAAIRLIQIHFALIMVVSGLHKLQFGDWWAGLALWFPLHPTFTTTLEQARAHAADAQRYLSLLSLGAYIMLAWQITFPLFAWRKPGWWAVMAGVSLGWWGASNWYDLFLFGPLMFTIGLSYMPEAHWLRLRFRPILEGPASSKAAPTSSIKIAKEKSSVVA